MKTRILQLFLLAACVMIGAGCSTTERSRAAAADAARFVARHRAEQEKRVQEVNDRYRETFTKVMEELTALSRRQTDQQMELSALRISDQMIEEWQKQSLPGVFRQTFLDLVRADYERLRSAEAALDQARQQYAEDLKAVSLKLNLLKDVENKLVRLAETPGQARQAAQLLQTVYAGYEITQKKEK